MRFSFLLLSLIIVFVLFNHQIDAHLQEVSLSSSTSSTNDDPDVNSFIVNLDDENFESITQLTVSLQEYLSTTTQEQHHQRTTPYDDWFLIFHSSSCFHCLAAAPALETFATEMRNEKKHSVRVGKIDCNPLDNDISSKTWKLCRLRFKVQAFPTMLFVFSENTSSSTTLASATPKKTTLRQIVAFSDFNKKKMIKAEDILQFVTSKDDLQRKISPRAVPWSDKRLEALVRTCNITGSWYDQLVDFLEDLNDEFDVMTRGKFSPLVFWFVFGGMAMGLIVALIVGLCDFKSLRRRRVREILEERKKQQQQQLLQIEKENHSNADEKKEKME